MIKDIKYQGHSAAPSDYECMDGELAGCYNLIPEDGALHPIMPPTIKFTLNEGEQLLWIHEMTGHTHYILMVTTTSNNVTTQSLAWVCEENADAVGENPWTRHYITGGTITGTPTISSIGNTLIVNDDNGIRYYLWKPANSDYLPLGQKPPMLEITFGLHSEFAVWPKTKNTGKNPGDFRGTYADVGRINDANGFPKLGSETDWQSAGWVSPRPVMAADTKQGDMHDRVREFAASQYNYSVEGMDTSTADNDDDMSRVSNKLSQGVFAAINKFVNGLGTEENKFVMPFFIRYAYRMYDGSYIMHSYPVLMVPNSRGPVFVLDGASGLKLADYNDEKIGVGMRGRAYGFLSTLVYSIASIPQNLSDWDDIITSVDIGVSAPIYTYDQAGKVYGWTNMDGGTQHDYDNARNSWGEYYSLSKVTKVADTEVSDLPQELQLLVSGWNPRFFDAFYALSSDTYHLGSLYGDYFQPYHVLNTLTHNYELYGHYPSYIATVPQRNIGEISKTLSETANFYVIKEITIDELATANEDALEIEKGVLGGLLGRSTMSDDYHTHDHLKASIMYNFNGRMNYANVERTPHNPLSPSIVFTQRKDIGSTGDKCTLTVRLKDEKREVVVCSAEGQGQVPLWIYYPDSNATEAFIYREHQVGGSTITYKYRFKLTPHTLLNGAYWLGNLTSPSEGEYETSSNIPTPSIGGINDTNKVYTSNVNNPFVFEPTNINTVGTGKILGLCAAVKPLADDQYGKAPLYVFSTEGIWAMDTTARGTYASVWPLSRDVCTNPDSITQLDDSVLFATDKGIMMLSGSQTQCITDAISSEFPFDIGSLPNNFLDFLDDDGYDTEALWLQPFSSFLASCRMIYDYVHQRIIVYNSSYNYAYVYSLKDHKWGMMVTNIDYGINSYPEALAVTDADNNGRRNVINLSQEILIDVNVKGLIITRPLKLDQPDALKTIDTIVQRGKFNFLDTSRTVKPIRSILFGSRDLYNWFLVSSSTDHNLRGFSGTPYKYFRIVALVDFLPDESVYGATIQYNPRYLNRPR